MSDIEIIIPSRYQSTRLPGKPLLKIAGIEMIRRVADIAAAVCQSHVDCSYRVATDDARIADFCATQDLPVVMTSPRCRNGTERCFAAISTLEQEPKLIVNLQGDNPLCPPSVVSSLIDCWRDDCYTQRSMDVYTPCVQLNWEEYAKFIDNKRTTPYTGTTVLVDKDGYALAFSKSPLPLIRNESKAKEMFYLSPLRQHIGLYAYTFNALQQFVTWSVSTYEQNCIEGLEQMRFLENGMKMKVVHVDYRGLHGEVGLHGGVDSPEDVTRVERILAENLYPNCF